MTEIRLIRRDAAAPELGYREDDASTAPSHETLNPLIRSVAGASIEQIDLVFFELQRIRNALHGEGARVSQDLARYASLNQSIQATMRVIRESLKPIASAN